VLDKIENETYIAIIIGERQFPLLLYLEEGFNQVMEYNK
jgi:hypothetical protein